MADHRYAVLSNGRGATAQVQARWGEIRSQYDTLLAVNTDAHVPVDRTVFFTRCRAWLRHNDFSHAIDVTCLDRFEADPGGRFASWQFRVPTGVGCWAVLIFRLSMSRGHNRIRLHISRLTANSGLKDDSPVSVVLRPDIEWRSFHEKTKAFTGPEHRWPAAIQAEPHGFVFRPVAGEVCSMRTRPGKFHHESQWSYMVGHPEDAVRGLDGSSDLFSPGWYQIDLRAGEHAVVTAEREDAWQVPEAEHTDSALTPVPAPADRVPLANALHQAMDVFVVKRDELLTVLAGYQIGRAHV
jgi:hypothetical protein